MLRCRQHMNVESGCYAAYISSHRSWRRADNSKRSKQHETHHTRAMVENLVTNGRRNTGEHRKHTPLAYSSPSLLGIEVEGQREFMGMQDRELEYPQTQDETLYKI